MTHYVELQVLTHFSLLRGASSPEELFAAAALLGCRPCGKAAQDYASKLLKTGNTTIRLTGKQSFGRPIGTVEFDSKDLGESMIGAGLAVPATGYLNSDPGRARWYVAAYARAQAGHAGVHSGYFIDPAKWHRGERLSCESRTRGRQGS